MNLNFPKGIPRDVAKCYRKERFWAKTSLEKSGLKNENKLLWDLFKSLIC